MGRRRVLLAVVLVSVPTLALAFFVGPKVTGLLDARVGVPRSGDRFGYHVTRPGETPFSPREDLLSFAWTGTETFPNAVGEPSLSQKLSLTVGSIASGGPFVSVLYPIGDAHPSGYVTVEGTIRQRFGAPVFTERVLSYRASPLDELFCLARSGWQGQSIGSLAQVNASAACPALCGPGAHLVALGDVSVGAYKSREFSINDPTRSASLSSVSIAFSDRVPYPTRLVFEDGPANRTVYELVAFEPAGDILESSGGVPAAQASPVAREAYGPNGPADGGTGGYPLEHAVEALRTDPALSTLGGWLRAHPEAIVVAATHSQAQTAPCPGALPFRSDETWVVQWAGGDASIVVATSTLAYGCLPLDAPPAADRAHTINQDGSVSPHAGPHLVHPPPDCVTFAQTTREMQRFAQTNEPVSTYGFFLGANPNDTGFLAQTAGGVVTIPARGVEAGVPVLFAANPSVEVGKPAVLALDGRTDRAIARSWAQGEARLAT